MLKLCQITLLLACIISNLQAQDNQNSAEIPRDSVAERMLLAQRSYGGWSQPNGDPFNYTKPLSDKQAKAFATEKTRLDATIDDDATTKEIRYLITAFKNTQNPSYLVAAENGLKYLLKAQNQAGGWGQFYPDTSGYHKHITYNDNSMINVIYILKYVVEGKNNFDLVNENLKSEAKNVLNKATNCILKTQYKQNGKLTVWCAQHDRITLQPTMARKFELASLSGGESVEIVRFLMGIDNPSRKIKKSIKAAITWFDAVKLVGINTKNIADSTQPKKRDRIVINDPNSTLWGRFYDLETNKPFFVGRDSVKKNTLAEIENERRVGYAYYVESPKKLLEKDYPRWLAKWSK
jgi:PelA/Pel-15E family pectate lyase